MKGTEKQIVWAEKILKTILEQFSAQEIERLKTRMAESKFLRQATFGDKEYSEEKFDTAIIEAKKHWENIENASKLIEEFQFGVPGLARLIKDANVIQ